MTLYLTTQTQLLQCFPVSCSTNQLQKNLPYNALTDTQFHPPTAATDNSAPEPLQPNDIKTEYHPCSGRKTTIEHFEDYGHKNCAEIPPLYDKKPWKPFCTRGDFEFAEIALSAALNTGQTDSLIKLLHRCINGQTSFTLDSHSELCQMWDGASDRLMWVCTPALFICQR